MEHKQKHQNNYTALKRKLFLRLMLVAVAASAVMITLYQLLSGRLGDMIVGFLSETFYLEYQDAALIFQFTVRNNYMLIMGVFFLVAFLIAFKIVISFVIDYFDEIGRGMDALIQNTVEPVRLKPELLFLNDKLKYCQQVIHSREADAKLAEQRKNDLVVYLAHDIRTPLTSIIGYLNLIAEAPDMPVEQRAKYIGITLDKAYRLEKLVDEFFEITRYSLQSVELEKDTVDLYYLLFQLIDEFYPLLAPDGKKAVLEADKNLAVYGDADKLARVFNNILKNAVAYSDPGSTVTVSARREGDMVLVTIKNVGKTIPKQKLSSIFNKFYRLDSARSTNTGGAGLGLAIAKEIVTLHGGTITAKSEDRVTAFFVTLPAEEHTSLRKSLTES